MSFKTSIILCTYNEAKYIENTIAGLEKNISNLEIVFSMYFASLYVHNIIEVLKDIIFYLTQFSNHYPS